jgi:hypothetical protein
MRRHDIICEYFIWLTDFVYDGRFTKLLEYLHCIEFTYYIPMDKNRAADGLALRYRFGYERNIPDAERYLTGPCTILEMMVALALRCEETIMDDPTMGNRTGQWFWNMVVSLELGSMTDDRFDKPYIDDVITRFLEREYRRDGKGGLFTVRRPPGDMRHAEIWDQMSWYLDTIT